MQSQTFILTIIQSIGYPVIIIGEMLEGIGIPFPGEITLLAASIYASSTGSLNIVAVIVLAIFGAYLGDNLGYFIGRKKGYFLAKKYGKFIKFNEQKFEKMQEYFKKHGSLVVFIGRFVTALRMFSPLLAGTNKMDYKKFAIFNFFGCFLWGLIYGIIGYFVGQNLNFLYKYLKPFELVILVVVSGLIAISIIKFYKNE